MPRLRHVTPSCHTFVVSLIRYITYATHSLFHSFYSHSFIISQFQYIIPSLFRPVFVMPLIRYNTPSSLSRLHHFTHSMTTSSPCHFFVIVTPSIFTLLTTPSIRVSLGVFSDSETFLPSFRSSA